MSGAALHTELKAARSALADAAVRVADAAARASAAEARVAALQAQLDKAERDREALHAAYIKLKNELLLLKQKLFVAKAERTDSRQLAIEFQQKLASLEELAGTLGLPAEPDAEPDAAANSDTAPNGDDDANAGQGDKPAPKKRGHSKGGRRNFRELGLQEQHVVITDPELEARCEAGEARRLGVEESYRLVQPARRASLLVIARQKYLLLDNSDDRVVIKTAPRPKELLPDIAAAPSMLAFLAVSRHCDGLPLNRIEQLLLREGFELDRGTMSRWLRDLGHTLGATVVHAMRDDAIKNAFCLATDATGIRLHPGERQPGAPRRPCGRGTFFVQIADRKHILFTYTTKETSASVAEMFAGYKGYVQADAKSVFDVLFRGGERTEVGCWAHARRKYWESAFGGSEVAREALRRIGRIFELDGSWRDLPPGSRKRKRHEHLAPHVDSLLSWAEAEYARVAQTRGTLRDALGYTVRQKEALRSFLQDGRLELTNNGSERELRQVAVGRKSWLFFGSEEHAEAAAELMGLVASARLHGLNPQQYLTELIRVVPYWPRERYLELSPAAWSATRQRLDPAELAVEVGHLTVPPVEQQGSTD